MKSFFYNILILLAVGMCTANDYCKSELCKFGTHIACNNDGKFLENCPDNAVMENITLEFKNYMLKAHNEKRNFIAGGGDKNHDSACRMATMQWDDEMASIAALNVRQCRIKHDKCHNTDTFKYSGQNLYVGGFFGDVNTTKMLQKAVNMWYREIEQSNRVIFEAFPKTALAVGHFSCMMIDKNIRVGCAASYYREAGTNVKLYLVACNYATTNMIRSPIYKSCSSGGAECKTGTNADYPNLCSLAEEYN